MGGVAASPNSSTSRRAAAPASSWARPVSRRSAPIATSSPGCAGVDVERVAHCGARGACGGSRRAGRQSCWRTTRTPGPTRRSMWATVCSDRPSAVTSETDHDAAFERLGGELGHPLEPARRGHRRGPRRRATPWRPRSAAARRRRGRACAGEPRSSGTPATGAVGEPHAVAAHPLGLVLRDVGAAQQQRRLPVAGAARRAPGERHAGGGRRAGRAAARRAKRLGLAHASRRA